MCLQQQVSVSCSQGVMSTYIFTYLPFTSLRREVNCVLYSAVSVFKSCWLNVSVPRTLVKRIKVFIVRL